MVLKRFWKGLSAMNWVKATPQLVELFYRLLPDASEVEKRQMFGLPCVFVNGNMFAGCFGPNSIILRLSEAERQEFLALKDAVRFEPSPGRVMREYVVAPQWMMSDEKLMVEWLEKALAFTSSIPRKEKKATARQAPRRTG
jgi:TfoX/Sxy family transcriptional regulator of competence genes